MLTNFQDSLDGDFILVGNSGRCDEMEGTRLMDGAIRRGEVYRHGEIQLGPGTIIFLI